MSEIAERVKGIVVDKLGVDANKVTEEATFINDLGADSLDTVELIMDLEKEFNITIPEDKAEEIKTVGDAIAFVEANQYSGPSVSRPIYPTSHKAAAEMPPPPGAGSSGGF